MSKGLRSTAQGATNYQTTSVYGFGHANPSIIETLLMFCEGEHGGTRDRPFRGREGFEVVIMKFLLRPTLSHVMDALFHSSIKRVTEWMKIHESAIVDDGASNWERQPCLALCSYLL